MWVRCQLSGHRPHSFHDILAPFLGNYRHGRASLVNHASRVLLYEPMDSSSAVFGIRADSLAKFRPRPARVPAVASSGTRFLRLSGGKRQCEMAVRRGVDDVCHRADARVMPKEARQEHDGPDLACLPICTLHMLRRQGKRQYT